MTMIFSTLNECKKHEPASCYWCSNKVADYGCSKKSRDKTKIRTIDHLNPKGWFRKQGIILYCVNPSKNNLVISCEACNHERGRVLDEHNTKVSVDVIDKWNKIHIDKNLPQFVRQ